MERKWITEIGEVMHFASTLLLHQNETGSAIYDNIRPVSNVDRAIAVPNSVDRIKFDFSTAIARRLKPSYATAV